MKQIVLIKSNLVKNELKFKENEEFEVENSCLEKTPMYIQRIFAALTNEIFSHKVIVDNLKEKGFAGFYLIVEDEVIPENTEKLDFPKLLDILKGTENLNVKFRLAVSKEILIPTDILKMASLINHALKIEMGEKITEK